MEINYFVGIDFGHGETSVSRIPGYNEETCSRIPLRLTSHSDGQKVISALCKKEGKWSFVLGKDDFKQPDIREGFKGPISKLIAENEKDYESLREFSKLIFETILTNDKELKFDSRTGEANFVVCIANPSDWRRKDANTPKKYLDFFRNECGIKPAAMCINESDAAFYTKHSVYSSEDTVFVIDLGSSTIDFTTYYNSECNPECCWGCNLGAHKVEDALVEKVCENKENEENILKVIEARKAAGLGSADAAISLAARFAKESFYTNHAEELEIKLRFSQLVFGGLKASTVFELILTKEELYDAIKEYRSELELTLENAVQKLKNEGIKLTRILLSGGASRMDFVKESTDQIFKKAFPKVEIDHDTYPEWVVSDGAAAYAKVYINAQKKVAALHSQFDNWANSNLIEAIQSAGLSAFQETLRESMREELKKRYIDSSSSTSLNSFENILRNILNTITSTYTFKSRADKMFIEKVNAQIIEKLKTIILEQYGKKISISESFIDPDDNFVDVPVDTSQLHENLNTIAYNLFCAGFFDDTVNWERARNTSERQQITDSAVGNPSYGIEGIPDTYCYNYEGETSLMIEEAHTKIDKILQENGLFRISI